MILRKPYAFFIKYFRVINVILSVLMAILIYQTVVIGRFLNAYIRDYTIANDFDISKYINFYSFLLCLIVIVLIVVITSVMFVKKKPMKLYIFSFIVSLSVFVLYIVDYNVMKNIVTTVLDIRVSKAIRDITFIVLGVQALNFIITLIRATGFDLKSFDFARDLKELEIDVNDNEEFEVALEVDKNKTRRSIRNKIRHSKYFYFEHRFVVNVVGLISLLIIVFTIVITMTMYSSKYSEGKIFNASGLQFNVKNSYLTATNQDGALIADQLLIVSFDVRKFSVNERKKLNTGLITLKVGNHYYSQTTKYNRYLTDIGTAYVDQELDEDFTNYILVFEINEEDIDETMYLKVNDNISYIRGEVGAKNSFVKLKPVDLDEEKETIESNIGDMVSFSGSLLGESTFKINKYEMNNVFKSEYSFCYATSKCYKSHGYITPTTTGNYYKTLLKIEGEFELDETLNIGDIDNAFDFLNSYGYIRYETNEEYVTKKIESQNVDLNNSDSVYYLEIDRDVLFSENVYLLINIRNYVYQYTLR